MLSTIQPVYQRLWRNSLPLHNITKKGSKGPPTCIKGTDYDLAFLKLKALITDTKLYLHHKDALIRLFLEVDASDVGWEACAYQMLFPYDGDQSEEGRMRIRNAGPRNIIQWTSKAWTAHELTLPVFYRESLARILALERFRNIIETNIKAGITLYTDHKPALFENSVSNKGQLSAWKIAEVAIRPPVNCGKPLQTRGGDVVRGPTIKSLCAHRRVVRSLNPKKASCVVRTLTTGCKKQRTHASVRWQRHICSWTDRTKMEKAYKSHIAREITHEGDRSNRILHCN
jgi:hypothetical protein